jgi:ABC-type sugar transport system substrate-binding protein
MKSLAFKVLFLAIFLIAANSCSNQPEHQYRIVFLQCCNDEWRDVMNSEMKRELAFHPEIELKIIESEFNTEKQVKQVMSLLKQNIDLLIITPNEAQPLTNAIEEIYKAGIPVVLIDRKINSGLYTAYVGADNYEIGKTAGEFIADKFKRPGNIIELKMSMTITPAIERYEGFNDAIAETQNLRIIDAFEAKSNLDELEDYLPNVLQKHPNVNIIFGQTDVLATTAYNIIKKMDKSKDLFFVGIDAIPIVS